MKDLLKHTIACRIAGCLAAFCLTFVSCTSVDDGLDTSRAITFQALQADTRVVVENGETLPADFRVWGWHGTDGANTDNIFDATVVYKDADWNYTDGVRYWKAGEIYNFYAVYPVFPLPTGEGDTQTTSTVTTGGTITVTNFDCSKTGSKAVDLMTATAIGVVADGMIKGGGKVGLTFQHALARVTCSVKSELSSVTVQSLLLANVGYKGTLTRTTTGNQWGELATYGTDNTLFKIEVPFELNATDGLSRDNVLGDLLLPPQQPDQAMFVLVYRYNNDTADRTATIGLPAGSQWYAGEYYNYTLTLKAASVTLNVSVKDWDEVNTSVSWGDGDSTTGSGS